MTDIYDAYPSHYPMGKNKKSHMMNKMNTPTTPTSTPTGPPKPLKDTENLFEALKSEVELPSASELGGAYHNVPEIKEIEEQEMEEQEEREAEKENRQQEKNKQQEEKKQQEGKDKFKKETQLPSYAETVKRPVAVTKIEQSGVARATKAVDVHHPEGSEEDPKRTVLQKHCDFFDLNKDGIITPIETIMAMRSLGFNWLNSLLAVPVIHPAFSFFTSEFPILPMDPFMRIWIKNIHKGKHGSDSGVFDHEGRFIPQKFEDIFAKWDKSGKDALDFWEILKMTSDQWDAFDFFGWFSAKFEWSFLYLLCADEQGLVHREDIRGVFDGTLFYRKRNEYLGKQKKTK